MGYWVLVQVSCTRTHAHAQWYNTLQVTHKFYEIGPGGLGEMC